MRVITIVNLGKNPQPFGEHVYEVRINEKVICQFKHMREEGLGVCLLEASKAVERQKWIEAAEFLNNPPRITKRKGK